MKIFRLINKKILLTFVFSMLSLVAFSSFLSNFNKEDIIRLTSSVNDASISEKKEANNIADKIDEYKKNDNLTQRIIVYDGMTMEELTAKLNRSLKSTMANKGELFASYSLQRGVDPYLAISIMLLETGCNWTCSSLVNNCNNVGGMKGSPGCGGGSFKRFSNLDEGINQFLKNLGENYYAVGLDTPEKMNPKYAESTEWARKVNNYINYIRKI